jgi:hypothetical protein
MESITQVFGIESIETIQAPATPACRGDVVLSAGEGVE